MMTEAFRLDLGGPLFWLMLAATVACLAVAGQTRARFAVMGCANAAFLWLIGGPQGLALALLLSFLLMIVVRRHGNLGFRSAVVGFSLTLALLFLLHKRQAFLGQFAWTRDIRGSLAALGFSYALLRLIEVLRAGWEGKTKSVNGLALFNYLFPFHMIAAGPIQPWEAFDPREPSAPASSVPSVVSGLDRIARGVFKKFVIAQAIQMVFLTGFKAKGWYLIWEVQMNYIWIFLDFSAYSDIATGAGMLLGVSTPENFNKPLSARNIIAFWERWHISLSTFIRRNIFTPILLSIMRRHPKVGVLTGGSAAFALAFLLCGLWHGLSLRFLIWGLGHAVALIACNLYRHFLAKHLDRRRMASYLANPWIQAAAIAMTFQFVAWSLAFVQHPALSVLG